MVADLFAIANLRRVHGRGQIRAADAACTAHDGRDRGQHIVSQKAAVGSGIGTELLFIKRLQTIQRLLRRVAEQPVCVALERGQIIKRRGFLALFLPVELGNDGVLAFAGVKRRVRVGFILEFLADSRKIREGQRCRVVALGLERTNFRVTTDDERQRRRHHTPDVQRAMIQNRKQPRGVDAHQPVCLGAAERRVVQPVIFRAVMQVRESIHDRVVLHRGQPQTLHWLFTSGLLVDIPENGFALAPGVTAVDDLGHVLALHERL